MNTKKSLIDFLCKHPNVNESVIIGELKTGSDMNEIDGEKWTVLMHLIAIGNIELVNNFFSACEKVMIENESAEPFSEWKEKHINAKDMYNWTALHHTCFNIAQVGTDKNNIIKLIEFLLENGAYHKSEDSIAYRTPLQLAKENLLKDAPETKKIIRQIEDAIANIETKKKEIKIFETATAQDAVFYI